jgi:hypothetical protein
MHMLRISMAMLLLGAASLGAQADTVARNAARLDSIARAVRDSVTLMRTLGESLDSTRKLPADAGRSAGAAQQPGSPNARLLPDVSAVGDFVADLSPKGSTQEDGTRLGVREVEIALQAVVDPYFRGDVFLGFSDAEGVAIEQAYLTATGLPNQFEARFGRFLMPFGKQNSTHRHDLHTIEYPYAIQRLFGPEGFKGTGLYAARVFAPFGFYQELQLTTVDRLGESEEELTTAQPVNRSLSGLGYSARLRNYFDLSEASNVELSFSGVTGRRAQPLAESYAASLGNDVNAAVARQSTLGADLTYRWRPLQQGIYRSFILQGEIMRQLNEASPRLPDASGCLACVDDPNGYAGPSKDLTGAYLFARYQTGQRTFLGTRYDYLQDPENDGRALNAGSVYLEWFPSEFSKLVAGYEAVAPAGGPRVHRLLLQAAFSIGPHKPHPF